jgi:hypothetical protein
MTPPTRAASCPRRSGSEPSNKVPPIRIGEAALWKRFAEREYLTRAATGELGCCLTRERTPQGIDEPRGTRSLTVSYVNEAGERVFIVHLYLRPDGTIGGSGKPDPKWLFEDGVIYIP